MDNAIAKIRQSSERVDGLLKEIQEQGDPFFIDPEFQRLFVTQEEFLLWKKQEKEKKAQKTDYGNALDQIKKNSEALKAKQVIIFEK